MTSNCIVLLALIATVFSAFFPTPVISSSSTAAAENEDEQVCADDYNSNNNNDTLLHMNVVKWIRDNGGYFNPKQQFQRVNKDDDSSPFGIFATDHIAKGELVASIPWKCVMTAGTDDWDTYLYCDSIQLIVDEMKKGEKSFFGPYVQYLLQHPPDFIASMWSDDGKRLLKKILGKQIPPKRATLYMDKYWEEECNGDPENLFEKRAAMQLVSRGDDDVLIPLYDLYNHRNGKWYNTEPKKVEGVKHELYASRDIEKGEEVYNSYNHCADCWNRHYNYGSAEVFRDYGFVEQYPQRWLFPKQEIAFDVDESESSGELEIKWLDASVHKKFGKLYELTNAGIADLRFQLGRLKNLNDTHIQPVVNELPELEADSITSFYNALTTALELAIESSTFYLNDDDDDDDDE